MDYFSLLLIGVMIILFLYPLADKVNIGGVVGFEKDKSFSEKKGKEIEKFLEKEVSKIPEETKAKAKKDIEENPEISELLYHFINNSKEIEKSLDGFLESSEEKQGRKKPILYQATELRNRNIISKELFTAIQYFAQKRNEILRGEKLSKEKLQEGIKISENISALLLDIMLESVDSWIEDSYDREYNR
ncbi:MAG: hypothetical protein WC178_01820 [Candidatus Paceibacterota bacterium]